MRGTFGVDFDLDTVRRVGEALPGVVSGGRWLVGRDARLTSVSVRDALVEGLRAAGVQVHDMGLCTTPMVYYFTAADGYDGSVMITASHNPPSDNGLKVSARSALPVGYANGLSEVEKAIASMTSVHASSRSCGTGEMSDEWTERYVSWLKSRIDYSEIVSSGLKIGIDASCGSAGILVRKLFPGAEIINDVPDGSFPAHSPNPLLPEARLQAERLVREQRLDCAVIFDGDADRAMFLDENGVFIQPDYLIPVVAKSCLAGLPVPPVGQPKVLHDVRTSRGAVEAIRELGCEPVMVPVGHAFAKPRMRELGALCGGELAGHYYFSDFFGCDSGVLAALYVLKELAARKKQGVAFSEMAKSISSRYANTGELNFRVEDKDGAIERVVRRAEGFSKVLSVSEIDGVRIDLDIGWVNVRKSNTEPYLRLVAEAADRNVLEGWTRELTEAIGS